MHDDPSQIEFNRSALQLGLRDTIGLMIGIVVGTAIFRSPPIVFSCMSNGWQAIGIWLVGGVLCLAGAVCYAELAVALPRNGGEYHYIRQSMGSKVGFVFAWVQLCGVYTASISALAYAFGDYAATITQYDANVQPLFAGAVVAGLCMINLSVGVNWKCLHNALSLAVLTGLLAIVGAAILFGHDRLYACGVSFGAPRKEPLAVGVALIHVLYAYGGWQESVYVAAEIRDRKRNIPRSLVGGLALIAIFYASVNWAYLAILGYDRAIASSAPATDAMRLLAGGIGATLTSILVMLAIAGSINGMLITSARLYRSLGKDYRLMRWLDSGDDDGPPVQAILLQAAASVGLIATVGTDIGRTLTQSALSAVGGRPIEWEGYAGGFEVIIAACAPLFWGSLLLAGVTVLLLRSKSVIPRGYAMPCYPVPPIVFCSTCCFMLHSSIRYAGGLAVVGVLIVLAGVLACAFVREKAEQPEM
ncbi:MAG: amino acid permease [Pseudomonadota bacterium]